MGDNFFLKGNMENMQNARIEEISGNQAHRQKERIVVPPLLIRCLSSSQETSEDDRMEEDSMDETTGNSDSFEIPKLKRNSRSQSFLALGGYIGQTLAPGTPKKPAPPIPMTRKNSPGTFGVSDIDKERNRSRRNQQIWEQSRYLNQPCQKSPSAPSSGADWVLHLNTHESLRAATEIPISPDDEEIDEMEISGPSTPLSSLSRSSSLCRKTTSDESNIARSLMNAFSENNNMNILVENTDSLDGKIKRSRVHRAQSVMYADRTGKPLTQKQPRIKPRSSKYLENTENIYSSAETVNSSNVSENNNIQVNPLRQTLADIPQQRRFSCLGSMTTREWKEHQQRIKALESPFQTVIGQHAELRYITPEILVDLISGKYNHFFTKGVRIIDCRFEYEYKGGHIIGAINITTPEKLLQFFESNSELNYPMAVVFHCEFSSKRGPESYKCLRKMDRERNSMNYPALFYPYIYCLKGGYKEFFPLYRDYCEPRDYVPMHDERFTVELKDNEKNRKITWKRSKSFSGHENIPGFEELNRLRMEGSMTSRGNRSSSDILNDPSPPQANAATRANSCVNLFP